MDPISTMILMGGIGSSINTLSGENDAPTPQKVKLSPSLRALEGNLQSFASKSYESSLAGKLNPNMAIPIMRHLLSSQNQTNEVTAAAINKAAGRPVGSARFAAGVQADIKQRGLNKSMIPTWKYGAVRENMINSLGYGMNMFNAQRGTELANVGASYTGDVLNQMNNIQKSKAMSGAMSLLGMNLVGA